MKQKQPTLKNYIALAVILAIFCCIVFGSFKRPIWFDEAYTANLIEGRSDQIIRMTALDVHPPLYYLLLRYWYLIFGHSIEALRAFSTFCAVIALFLVYKLSFRWSKSNVTSLFLTIAVALCPFFIYYASEMRMYTMTCAIVIGGTLALDYALKEKKKKYWIIYAITITLAFYTQYFAVLPFLAHAIYILYYFKKHGMDKQFIITYPLAAALCLPWLPALLSQASAVVHHFWPDPVEPVTLLKTLSFGIIYYQDILKEAIQRKIFFSALFLIVFYGVVAVKCVGQATREKLFEIFLLVIVPPLMLFIISLPPFQSLYVDRYVISSLMFLWLFVGVIALAASRRNLLLMAPLVAIMLVCSYYGVNNIYRLNNNVSVFKNLASYIELVDDEYTPVIYDGYDAGVYDQIFYETKKHPVFAYSISRGWGATVPVVEYEKNYLKNIEEFMRDNDTFWYVTTTSVAKTKIVEKMIGEDKEIVDSLTSKDHTVYKITKMKKQLEINE